MTVSVVLSGQPLEALSCRRLLGILGVTAFITRKTEIRLCGLAAASASKPVNAKPLALPTLLTKFSLDLMQGEGFLPEAKSLDKSEPTTLKTQEADVAET